MKLPPLFPTPEPPTEERDPVEDFTAALIEWERRPVLSMPPRGAR